MVSILFAVAGCGGGGGAVGAGDDAGPRFIREGVIQSAAGGAGTQLLDGFRVAEGTTLIGDPIPAGVDLLLDGQPVMGDGWTARFAAHGDADTIMDAYLRQAADLGLERLPVPEPSTGESNGSAIPGNHFGTCALVRGHTWCRAVARSPQPQPARIVELDLVRSSSGDQPVSHLTLKYSATERDWSSGNAVAHGSAYGDTEAPLAPPPAVWPPLPEAGESFGDHLVALGELEIAEGTRLAAAPLVNQIDQSFVVAEVTGDPAQVLSAYRDQLLDIVPDVSDPERLEVGDTTLTTIYASEAGGDQYELQVVQRPGRPTWLTAAGSHD